MTGKTGRNIKKMVGRLNLACVLLAGSQRKGGRAEEHLRDRRGGGGGD